MAANVTDTGADTITDNFGWAMGGTVIGISILILGRAFYQALCDKEKGDDDGSSNYGVLPMLVQDGAMPMRGRHRIHPTSSSRGLPSSRRAPTAGSSRVSIVRPSAHRLPGSYRRQLQRASRDDKRNAQASGLKHRLRRSRRRSGWGERQFDVLGRAYNEQSQAPQPGKSRLRRHSALEQRRISSKVKVPGVSSAMLRRVMSESSLTSRVTRTWRLGSSTISIVLPSSIESVRSRVSSRRPSFDNRAAFPPLT